MMNMLGGPMVWLLVAVVLAATSGGWAWAFRRRPVVADRVGAAVLAAGSALGLVATAASLAGGTAHLTRDWALPWGRFDVAIDGLSAAFLFPVLAIPALAGLYGTGGWSQRAHPENAAGVRLLQGVLTAAMSILVVARDGVLFLMAFEVVSLAAFFLVTAEDERPEVRDAGWVYLVASHLAFVLLLGAFTLLRAATGAFALDAVATGTAGAGLRSALFLLAFVAFALKAGIMPFHVWLPAAHANAPSHVSAILSGVVLKIGIYGLMRFLAMLPDPPLFWGVSLLLLGAGSGVAGVVFAIGQHDLKRLLAYHSIENIGIIVMGLGLATVGRWAHAPVLVVLGVAAAVLHVWNHALFKSLLFLSAGVVVHASGTRDIDRLGGLARTLPWTAALFTLGSVAICGLPPLNGFVSEFILYLGALRGLQLPSAWPVSLAAPVLALIGALACACFVKVIGTVFLGSARIDAGPVGRECGWWMRAPMLFLALLCLAIGVAPGLVAPGLEAAAAGFVDVPIGALPALAAAVPFRSLSMTVVGVALAAGILWLALWRAARNKRTAGTWDCGFLSPGPRMQYTGSSFARGLVELFAFLLRPREEATVIRAALPAPVSYRRHVDDVVLERWVLPLARWCAAGCSRIRDLQSARIQTYIAYVLAATLGLLAWLAEGVGR